MCLPYFFFWDGKAVMGCYTHFLSAGMYKRICRNSDRMARQAAGLKPSLSFIRPQHICTPFFKSVCDELYDKVLPEIEKTSAARTRTAEDLNQYMFWDYMYFKGMVLKERISNKHFSAATATVSSLTKFLQNPMRKLVCINDVHLGDAKFEALRNAVTDAFEKLLPEKSKYEL